MAIFSSFELLISMNSNLRYNFSLGVSIKLFKLLIPSEIEHLSSSRISISLSIFDTFLVNNNDKSENTTPKTTHIINAIIFINGLPSKYSPKISDIIEKDNTKFNKLYIAIFNKKQCNFIIILNINVYNII